MSIIFSENNLTLLDHRKYITKIYKNTNNQTNSRNEITNYTLTGKLFCIKTNKQKINKKRPRKCDEIIEEAAKVRQMYNKLMQKLPLKIKCDIRNEYNVSETLLVREFAKRSFESTAYDHQGLKGGNNSDSPLQCKVKDDCFLIPEYSKFLCGCVKEQCIKLLGNTYDILIADPPWWNKYIRRLKETNDKLSYKMMYNEDIASIQVRHLLSANCLIAVWCTNAPSNIAAVKEIIFPQWRVEYVTTWYWLKVDIDLQPMYEFGVGSKKQPYERVVIGKVGNVRDVPKDMLVASVPSALHSHKPPLLDLLKSYIDVEEPKILEIFARYLLPHTTSVGYETLKWQHMSLYEEINE